MNNLEDRIIILSIYYFLNEILSLQNISEFNKLKNEHFINREKIINTLAKNSFLNKNVETETLKKFQNKIKSISNKLHYYINDKFNNISTFITKEVNYLEGEKIFFSVDSEDKFFILNNIRKESSVNNNSSFWQSSNDMIEHWIFIDFLEYKIVNKIMIEHHSFSVYITKQFSIYELSQHGWIKLEHIKENTKNIIYFCYDVPKKFKKIKIYIEKLNYSIDYAARIKSIKIF